MHKAILFLLAASMAACGGGVGVSVVKSPNYVPPEKAHRYADVLLVEPTRPYVEVGTVEIRLSRAKKIDQLFHQWLPGTAATELGADAVLPPRPENMTGRNLAFETTSQFKPYFLFDDGKTIVIAARAIRYK